MEVWIIGIILTVVELAITTIVGLLITRWWNKKEADRTELETLREEKRQAEEGKRCELVKTAIHEEVVALEERLNKQSDERFEKTQADIALLKDGLQKDLYVDLCNIYDQYKARVKTNGYITRGEKTEYDKLYWTYHNLGKNGVADGMHDDVMKMPEEPKGE